MIIAIALQDNVLNSGIHPQFGRCPWFAVYNSRSDQITYLKNTEQNSLKEAGLSAASLLISIGVSKVVAGRFGMKAADYLRGKQVQMIVPHKEDMTLYRILGRVNPDRVKKL